MAAERTKGRGMADEHTRYLGTLGLLAECAVHLGNGYEADELRDSIERALEGAEAAMPGFRWRRILDSFEVWFAGPDEGLT